MSPGYTVADMANDYAQVITEDFGDHVDLVVGESFGGMIAQYLAAFHPNSFGHIAMVVTAAVDSDWSKEVDCRLAAALARGDAGGAGTEFAEYLLPGERMRWVRRLIGPLVGRLFLGNNCPPQDVLVEVQAGWPSTPGPCFPASRHPSCSSAATVTGSSRRT
jgi:pimeloyl-ACP methyl ester carboxylesterase